jgi:hypothetical protein
VIQTMKQLLVGVFVVLVPLAAGAQSSRVDVSASVGQVRFGGQSPFDIATVGTTAVVWVTDRFGVSWSMDVGSEMVVDAQLSQQPFPQSPGDRRGIERGNVRLQRATLRYRRPLWSTAHLVLGGGVLISAAVDRRYLLAHTLTDIEERRDTDRWGGLSFEALLRQRLVGPLAVEGGIVREGALDRWHLHPVAQLSLSFGSF